MNTAQHNRENRLFADRVLLLVVLVFVLTTTVSGCGGGLEIIGLLLAVPAAIVGGTARIIRDLFGRSGKAHESEREPIVQVLAGACVDPPNTAVGSFDAPSGTRGHVSGHAGLTNLPGIPGILPIATNIRVLTSTFIKQGIGN